MSSGAGHSGDSSQSGKCAHCGAQLRPPLLHCARCKSEHYCSKACQILAWKAGHKIVCMQEGGAREIGSHRKAVSNIQEAREQDTRAGAVTFRFPVGTRVWCMHGHPFGQREEGRVVQHHYEEPRGVFHPYQIRLDLANLFMPPMMTMDTFSRWESRNDSQPTHAIFCGASAVVAEVRGENEVMAPRIRNQASGLACSKPSSRVKAAQVP